MARTADDRSEAGAACADAIEEIARRVDRLTICRRDPERFFEERSELASQLRCEAMRLRA